MSPKMKRTQLYIEPELDRQLQHLALSRHVSKAYLLREGAKRLVQEELPQEEDPIMYIIDLGHGGPGNVSKEHDKYLAELKLSRRKK